MAVSLPTPQIGHLTDEDYDKIYEPAEDSFILLDALEQDAEDLKTSKPTLCVEIGSGSGIASTFLAQILGTSGLVLSIDVNPHACLTTIKTGNINGVSLEAVRADLLNGSARVKGKVDILLFNPPYVPTSETELAVTQDEKDIGGSWAGGNAGMQVTDRLLSILPDVLAPCGRMYLVTVEQNDPKGIIERMGVNGLQAEITLKRRAGRELLSIVRISKSSQ